MKIKIILYLSFFCTIISLSYARIDAGSLKTEVVQATPQHNGYVITLKINYIFRRCYDQLSINIDRKNSSSLMYKYKDTLYAPSDLGLTSFDKVSVSYVDLWVDVYDRNTKVGRIKLANLTKDSGGGCFGQTYDAGKLLGIDGRQARKRPQDFELKNFEIKISSQDYKIESLINKKKKGILQAEEKKNDKDNSEKSRLSFSAGVHSNQLGGANLPLSSKLSTSINVTNSKRQLLGNTQIKYKKYSSRPLQHKKSYRDKNPAFTKVQAMEERKKKSQEKRKKEIEKFQKHQSRRTKMINHESKKVVNKVANAASSFYSGLKGSNTSLGASFRFSKDRGFISITDPDFYAIPQSPLWVGIVFGRYWNPLDPKTQQKWISAFEIEFAINTKDTDISPLTNGTRNSNWTRYDSALMATLVSNITMTKVIQPYFAFGLAFFDSYDLKDVKIDSGTKLVTEYGIAFNIGGLILIKVGYNADFETTNLSFGVKF